MAQYRGLVLASIQHAAKGAVGETDEYWVNRTFQRFWMAVRPERFGLFPNLAAVLQYLKLCAHSVLLDELRARRASQVIGWDAVPVNTSGGERPEALVLSKLAGDDLWSIITRHLQDEPERIVAYRSFVLGLKAGEIYAQFRTYFADVGDVYRVKRNLLDRLRRNSEIRAFIQ